MPRHAKKFKWVSHSMALFFCIAMSGAGTAFAQTETSVPPPPPDQGPSLQQAAPESQVRAVRISAVEGEVKVVEGEETAFQQAQINMPVVEGMKLVTAQDGRAEVQFEDGSVARVAPNSAITLKSLSRDEGGSTVTVVQADAGLTYYELNGSGGTYSVQFGQHNISIDPVDSAVFRLDLDKPEAELAVMHGTVHISNDQNLWADVHTDQSVRFDPRNADEYQLVQSVAANSWDQWNSDRDEALAEMDASESDARAGMEEPNNPAWSDLDANGDWYDVPGYGMGWSPDGVGADWDPYGLGSWGYYSGVGYTWISGYSWGWWPYHCGSWSWLDGFGWMWFPSNCGWSGAGIGAWYPYGTILSVPPNYRCPRRPLGVHRPGRHPIRHPNHGPVRTNPRLIAVNRGSRATQQLPSLHTNQPKRMLQYAGRRIAPVERVHPLREGFNSTVRRTEPGLTNSLRIGGAYAGSTYRPSMNTYRRENSQRPQRVKRANPGPATPGGPANLGFRMPSRSVPPGVVRAPAPVFHAPRQAFHAPPTPAFHARPTPAFHAPPTPAFHGPAAAPAGHGRH